MAWFHTAPMKIRLNVGRGFTPRRWKLGSIYGAVLYRAEKILSAGYKTLPYKMKIGSM